MLKFHVAFYLSNLAGAGSQRVMVNLIHGFVEAEVRVSLVLDELAGPFLTQVPSEVEIIDLKGPNSFWTSVFKLLEYIHYEKPRFLISAMHLCNEVALWAKHLSEIPIKVVVTEHSHLSTHAKNAKYLNDEAERWSTILTKLFYPWADHVIAVSEGVAKDLISITNLDSHKIKVIYNPVISNGLLEKSKQKIKHPFFNEATHPVILSIGRLELQKDFPTLIRAFARVRELQPAHLIILGEGQERTRIETLVKELCLEDDISLPGFVNNPYPYMAQAAMFVLSSAWEGLPTVLIEAMAFGTPVISTNCNSGPSEILNRGQYGQLVPVGDYEMMAEAILSVLSTNPNPVDCSWLNQFTIETATKKYMNFLGMS